MMKQTISSPIRKLKLLLVLPLMAGVFYAFAAPEYKFVQVCSNNEVISETTTGKTVTGKVINEDGKPLKGASIVVSGKTIGTTTDANGNFKLEMPDDSPIVISYIGFGSQKINPDFEKEMVISMKTAIIDIDLGNDISASKSQETPNPSSVIIDGNETTKAEMVKINPDKNGKVEVLKDQKSNEKYGEKSKEGVIKITMKTDDKTSVNEPVYVTTSSPIQFRNSDGSGSQPLIVKDGVIANDQNADNISPETIESIEILKGEAATILYGEKGRNGVILISTKKGDTGAENEKSSIAQTVEVHTNSPFKFRNSVGLEKQPLMVVDGVIAENQNIGNFEADSIHFLKGESATKKYGERGRKGVNEIYIKKAGKREEAMVTGPPIDHKPLIVIDGVIAENQNMDKIDPESVASMAVLKDESATKKYGDKAKNGVIEITSKSKNPFIMVEEMPEFPGGIEALRSFVSSTMKYPAIALENGIQGKVFVNFVVTKTGSVTNVKVIRGIDPSLDNEAIRVVEAMPKWKSGKQNGENVDVSYTVPVNFELKNYKSVSKEKLTVKSYRETKTTFTKSRPDSKESKTKPVVDQTIQTHQLIIVPNPAKDKATITLEGSESTNKLKVSVYDKYGKLIKKESKNGPTFSLSLTSLASGTYLIVTNDGTNQFSGQLIVNH